MNRKIELLAPGGDIDSIKSAILAGADAGLTINEGIRGEKGNNDRFEAAVVIQIGHISTQTENR